MEGKRVRSLPPAQRVALKEQQALEAALEAIKHAHGPRSMEMGEALNNLGGRIFQSAVEFGVQVRERVVCCDL